MARKTMWAVAGALLAFAPLASAATYSMGLNNPRVYASELITGPDVEIDYDGATPEVSTTLNFGTAGVATAEIGAIEQGDVIEVTITLHNAKFGENVKTSDMSPAFTGVGGCTARVKDVEGGEQGTSTVTFEVEAATGDCTVGTAPHFIRFPFELPTLEGLNRRPVNVTVTTDAGGGSGFMDTSDSGVTTNPACSSVMTSARTACLRLENGVLARLAAADANKAQATLEAIVSFTDGLTFAPSTGVVVGGSRVATASIDLAGGRLGFVNDAPARLASVSVGVTSATACTTDDPIPPLCYRQTDGREFSIGRGGEGQGDLMVSVTGDFRDGDTVWLEHDGASGAGAREMLDLQDDGSMTGTFALNDVAGNARAVAGDDGEMDREEGIATRGLFYAPNGDDGLRPGTFRSSFAVDFDSDDVRDKGWRRTSGAADDPGEFTTTFTIVEDTKHAYAIPELGATDEGNVRIKCEVATECTVYLECDDTAGTSRFGRLDAPIDGRSTETLNAAAIADALDFGDDGWEGSLSCTVYSTRAITVQVLVRSADVLVNQTYIEND